LSAPLLLTPGMIKTQVKASPGYEDPTVLLLSSEPTVWMEQHMRSLFTIRQGYVLLFTVLLLSVCNNGTTKLAIWAPHRWAIYRNEMCSKQNPSYLFFLICLFRSQASCPVPFHLKRNLQMSDFPY
jgi:hypothetical protein